MSHQEQKELRELIELLKNLFDIIKREFEEQEKKISYLFKLAHRPNALHIQFEGVGLDMDLSLNLSPTAGALGTPVETKADGSSFTFDPTKIVWSVQDGSIVKFVQNADGTAQFTPLAVGSTQIGLADTATGLNKVVKCTVTSTGGGGGGAAALDITFSNITQ